MHNPLAQLLATLALLIIAACGGGGTPEDRAIAALEKAVAVLEGVESPADVDAALEELEAIGEEMKEINDEVGSEMDFSEEQQERLDAVKGRFRSAVAGVMQFDPDARLVEAFGRMNG